MGGTDHVDAADLPSLPCAPLPGASQPGASLPGGRRVTPRRLRPERSDREHHEVAQRLLSFRLACDVVNGRRELTSLAPSPQLEPVPDQADGSSNDVTSRRFDVAFLSILERVTLMPPEAVLTANMLINDGMEGSCQELLHTADLLSR